MDVDRVQKVNNLALDLMNQGLAPDRDNAIEQAEKILGHGTEEYSEMRERMEEVNHKETEENNSNNNEELSQDQIKNILGENTKFIIKTFKEFNAKIVTLEKEISNLKEQVKAGPTVKEIVSEVKSPEKPQQSEQSNETPQNQENKNPHPRSGNYNDTDVSIEKFFYMGKK